MIVSQDPSNDTVTALGRGTVTVVPLTSNVAHVARFQALIPAAESGLPQDSKAQAEQVRTVDVGRLRKQVGSVPDMAGIDAALRVHLAL